MKTDVKASSFVSYHLFIILLFYYIQYILVYTYLPPKGKKKGVKKIFERRQFTVE